MICSQCGHRNSVEANYCSACGAALARVRDDLATTAVEVQGEEEGFDDEEEFVVPEPDMAAGMLVVRRGPNSGARFSLGEPCVRVGRHPESDIFLDDITVSRRHAEFVNEDGREIVRDVGSLNGTYVNRERVEEAVLSSGDEVQIGKFKFVYVALASEDPGGRTERHDPGRAGPGSGEEPPTGGAALGPDRVSGSAEGPASAWEAGVRSAWEDGGMEGRAVQDGGSQQEEGRP